MSPDDNTCFVPIKPERINHIQKQTAGDPVNYKNAIYNTLGMVADGKNFSGR